MSVQCDHCGGKVIDAATHKNYEGTLWWCAKCYHIDAPSLLDPFKTQTTRCRSKTCLRDGLLDQLFTPSDLELIRQIPKVHRCPQCGNIHKEQDQ